MLGFCSMANPWHLMVSQHRNHCSDMTAWLLFECMCSDLMNTIQIISDGIPPSITSVTIFTCAHDDVIKWKHFPRYWPFVRGIHRSPVNSPYKGQWRGALMFSLICVRINSWVNNGEAGDLRRHRSHYDVIVMSHVIWVNYSAWYSIVLKFRHQRLAYRTLWRYPERQVAKVASVLICYVWKIFIVEKIDFCTEAWWCIYTLMD